MNALILSLLVACALLSHASLVAAALEDVGDAEHVAQENQRRNCMVTMIETAAPDMTVAELRQACDQMTLNSEMAEAEAAEAAPIEDTGLLEKRRNIEALNRSNRFLLTPHNRNYVLPANYTKSPNPAPFEELLDEPVELQNTEIEFQLSMKVLVAQDLFHNNGNLYIAYTNHSFWQAYNTDISRPFRETNHEPELIISVDNDWEILGFKNVLNQMILSHQSNGQSGTLSRSWNRIKFNTVFERGDFAFSFTPWYRLPEDVEDDDNPDIKDYYGSYELTGAYTRNDHIVSFLTRRPFSSTGAMELGWSFPVSSTMRGYLKYFNGYGANLLDYNVKTESVGLGVVFTDLF